jgi:uncharacterized membrane protein
VNGRDDGRDDVRVRQVELLISRLLRAGILASLVLLVAGTTLTFVHHPRYLTERASLDALTATTSTFPHTPRDVVVGLAHLRGQALVTLGLLVLIATPVVRVAVSIVGFAYQRDRAFVAITALVLGLLVASFVLGGAA